MKIKNKKHSLCLVITFLSIVMDQLSKFLVTNNKSELLFGIEVFRGLNFVKLIVNWAVEFGKENKLEFVRLDTLGNNTKLIEHYTNAGFTFLGIFDLKNTDQLPAHYQNEPACLFEIKIEK